MTNTNHTQESGFTLIEVLVAFTILSTVLGTLYAALGGGARRLTMLEQRARTMAHAESHLDRLIASRSLTAGVSTGAYADGTRWQLTATALPMSDGPRDIIVRPLALDLVALDAHANPLLRMRSVTLVTRER